MGADAADINNDALPDITTLDMMPEYNDRKKVVFSFMNYERYQIERLYGYDPEFARNMLQLHNGTLMHKDTALNEKLMAIQPVKLNNYLYLNNRNYTFTDYSAKAGVDEPSLSGGAAYADIDNDGDMDLVAGNLGLNCKYHVSPEEPIKLFAKDIDGNGSIDPVPFYYIKDETGTRHLYPAEKY